LLLLLRLECFLERCFCLRLSSLLALLPSVSSLLLLLLLLPLLPVLLLLWLPLWRGCAGVLDKGTRS
jgi:hypothetical protein